MDLEGKAKASRSHEQGRVLQLRMRRHRVRRIASLQIILFLDAQLAASRREAATYAGVRDIRPEGQTSAANLQPDEVRLFDP